MNAAVKISPRIGGASIIGSGGGGKGKGGSARTPTEEPDSLRNISYAALVDVISNGEVEGPAHPSDPLRDIYLNGTPIQNADGSLNFRNVQVEYRNGTQDQEHIPGFPASANVVSVGTEVTTASPWTQVITNPDLSAVRVTIFFPQLLRTVDSGSRAGDRVGYSVTYAIDLAIGAGAFTQVYTETIDGKTVNGYAKSTRIELPASGGGWTIRVRRVSPDSGSTTIQDAMYLQSYAEVIDGKFRYPMSAVVGIKIDAEQFQSVPARAYRWRGIRIRVPSNYDPETRTYTGVWNGTFKTAWSNNPAWVFYDIITSTLYGLGDRVNAAMIDRYALYQIGYYCDQMVSDGQGGTEPRFVCNCYLQSRADALKVINDLASVFRGMAYWANNQVVPVADMPADPVYTFTNANVIDGKFTYPGADISTRKTVALVSWNDPSDFYRSKVEIVNDDIAIARYGIRKAEVVAFGCTSRGQAQRVGNYVLYTSSLETGGVTFSVGLDGVIPQPGDIVRIADRNRAGRAIGGRISLATINAITMDRDAPVAAGNTLTVNLPSGVSESRTVQSVAGRVVTVTAPFSAIPLAQSVWAIDAEDLVTQLCRISAVREAEGITFGVAAVFHHPGKFDAIDNGTRLDPLPVSVIPPRAQLAPANVAITEHALFKQGTTRHTAEITWDAPDVNAVAYDVQWRRDNGDWVVVPRTGTRLVEIPDIYAGLYVARVRAINSLDVPSLWAYSDPTQLNGLVSAPPVVTFLNTTGEVMAIRLDWGYPTTPNIIERVELRASLSNDFGASYALTEIAYPATSYTLYGLGYSTEMWFWARLIDKNGTPGEWFPLSTGAGVYGKPNQDPSDILDYLQGQIGEGELAPGLIEEITEDVAAGVADEVIAQIMGDSIGETVLDAEWFVGDDESMGLFVGSLSVSSVIGEGDFIEAKRTEAVVAQVNETTAVVREIERVFIDDFQAVAEAIQIVAVQVENQEAVVQETSRAVIELGGAVSATYQIKTQVRSDGRVVQAGVALGAAIGENGAARSEIIMMADTIAFVNTLNGALHAPFIFDVANDTAVLNTAFIGNATIGSGKFIDWLESDAVGPGGVPVLRLNFRTGEIQLNPSMTATGRMTINNRVVAVYDAAGTLRVKLGDLS